MPDRGFSIDLGPELDHPYTKEWGWIEDAYPEQTFAVRKKIRSFRAKDNERERQIARRNRGPKVIPPRELPAEHEAAMEGRPVEVKDPMDEFAADVSMDALHDIAQQLAERQAA